MALSPLILGLLAVVAVSSINAARQYKMVCYYASWATYRWGDGKFTSQDIDPHVCTHLVYAFAGLDVNYEIRILDPWLSLPDGGGIDDFRKFTGLKYSNPDLKLMIGVGGWNEGSPRYSQMAASAKNRKVFIDSVIRFIRNYNFDGLNLDWQYPANRGGLGSDKTYFVVLLKELRAALSEHNLLLGIAAAGNLDIINAGYDVPEVTKQVDYVSLLTYDYHGAWEPRTGMNAPIYPRKGASASEKALTQDATVNLWIQKGADKSKLLLGMSTYGRTFILNDKRRNGVGDPSFRPGNPGRFTQQDGFLGYNEIVEQFNERDGWVYNVDHDTKVPYVSNEELWISYDNEWSFGLKAEYLKQQGLGGAMLYSLDTDDIQGLSGTTNPLAKAVKAVLEDGNVIPPVTPPTPPTHGTGKPPIKFECKSLGLFQDPQNCRRYYTCLAKDGGFHAVINTCPQGLAFDNVAKSCNWIDAVPEC